MERDQGCHYVIIPPDGYGSKGDEAMIGGCLHLLQGQRAMVLTPNHKHWSDHLLGKAHLFDEKTVPIDQFAESLPDCRGLIVVGADVMDGTQGYENVRCRVEVMKAAAKRGITTALFCSIRSGMESRVVQALRSLPESVHVFLRDPYSERNFKEQIGRRSEHFSDLAFFNEPIDTMRAETFRHELSQLKKHDNVIGLEISETMFRSCCTEITDENRVAFARKVALAAVQGLGDVSVVLLTHDSRSWGESWSDHQYAMEAYRVLTQECGVACLIQPPDITQAELLSVVPDLDMVICGRMHMSVTTYCAGVIPLIATGHGKCFDMSDKVRGMCCEWMGTEDNFADSIEQIPVLRDRILTGALNSVLQVKREQIMCRKKIEAERFAQIFGVEPVYHDEREAVEMAQLRVLERAAMYSDLLEKERAERRNKEAHIEMLLQSERDLQGECQRLRDEERQYLNELNETRESLRRKSEELSKMHQQMNGISEELDRIRNSRSWRMMTHIWKVRDIVIPFGSRRRKVLKYSVKAIRHPAKVLKALSPKRLKKLLSEIWCGDWMAIEAQMSKHLGIKEDNTTPPQILALDMPAQESGYPALFIQEVDEPLVSIIIPVYNQFDYTYLCIKSIILNSGDVPYEIIVADDCSTDTTTKIQEIISGVHVARTKKNLRFLLNCNHAAKQACGRYILFLNNDTQVQKGWLRPLVDLIESDARIGMVGSKLIYPDGRLQEAGGILWRDGSAWNYGNGQNPALPEFNYVKDVDYISGAAIMIRRELWESIGGFDERFAPAYCEDSDLAFAVRKAGYKVLYQPKSVVVHFEGVSNGTDTSSGLKAYQVENQKKFFEKWKHVLAAHEENGVNVFKARDRSLGKKTVLFVDHYVPTYDMDAGSRTVFAYLKMFVQQGFNVKFIGDNFYQSEPYTTALQQMGVEVLYGSWYAQNWKEWILRNSDCFDYAFLNRPHIAVNYIDFLKKHTKAKIVYYGHDLHFLRMTREYELTGDKKLLSEAADWKERELSLMRKADMAYYPSEVEVKVIREIDPQIRVKAIPAYLFDDVESVDYRAGEREGLFFIGGFRHGPNVDAVKWLASEIMPLLRERIPEIEIHIAGSCAPEELKALEGNGIKLEGAVSDEELARLYRQCRLTVVPLRYGAGIKGKVIESMRFGLPVVTTPCGAEGILNAEDCLTVAESAAEMAERIAALYEDKEKLASLSRTGISYCREHFTQKNAVRALDDEFHFATENSERKCG